MVNTTSEKCKICAAVFLAVAGISGAYGTISLSKQASKDWTYSASDDVPLYRTQTTISMP